MAISRISWVSPVAFDRTVLQRLYGNLGAARADELLGSAAEEIAMLIARILRGIAARDGATAREDARNLALMATELGMTELERVCGHVDALVDGADPVALAACSARLKRVGEGSLMAVWEPGA